MFHNEILPDFFKCCLEACFTTALLSFTVKVVCQGAHLRLLYVLCRLLKTGRVSLKFIVLLPYSTCYLSRCRLSFRCSMSKCVMQSAVWDSEAQQDMSVQRPFCPDFPCKSVMHIISGNLFYSLSKDTFSHSSVITAYSQAVICTTCVWKHLGVFLPIILARDESHLQPCSSSNKSFLSEHKDDWWARHLRHTHWLDKEWSAAKQTGQ